MLVLALGIVLMLGVHTLATLRETRGRLVERFGLQPYKAVHSLIALLGLVLIVWGFSRYRAEGLIVVWTPPAWGRYAAIALMWCALVALACMNPAPGRIRGWVRHPMLTAVMIWGLAHLLANGDAGGALLFGSFLAWSIYDRVAVTRRSDFGAAPTDSFTRADATALAVGTVAFIALMFLHPFFAGVAAVG